MGISQRKAAKAVLSSRDTRIDLQGKDILFLAPRFFSYEHEIAEEMRRRGAQVDWLPDRPLDTPLMTAVTRLHPQSILPIADKLYRRQLNNWGRKKYDLIFVLNGQTLSRALLAELRTCLPNARFVLYMWDSIVNRASLVEKLDLFDECLSFDPSSVAQYGMRLRPLFFSPGFESESIPEPQYHISFIGTAHTDRYSIISSIDEALKPNIRRFWHLYLQARWVYAVYRYTNRSFRGASLDDFRFNPLSGSAVRDIFKQSRAVLDVEHPRQTGLTMRSFETLGAKKKLVTTNFRVRELPFYSEQNILVIDRSNPQVDTDFLLSPYVPVDPLIYNRYSLSGWLDEVLMNSFPNKNLT